MGHAVPSLRAEGLRLSLAKEGGSPGVQSWPSLRVTQLSSWDSAGPRAGGSRQFSTGKGLLRRDQRHVLSLSPGSGCAFWAGATGSGTVLSGY